MVQVELDNFHTSKFTQTASYLLQAVGTRQSAYLGFEKSTWGKFGSFLKSCAAFRYELVAFFEILTKKNRLGFYRISIFDFNLKLILVYLDMVPMARIKCRKASTNVFFYRFQCVVQELQHLIPLLCAFTSK